MATASCRRALLDPFQTFLERLSQEIEEEQLESLKFLLEKQIPAGTLEKCTTPRKLFKCMKQKSLLGYNNLDFLADLLKVAQRSDLVEIVEDFKQQPTMEIDSGYPGNYGIINYVYAGLSVSFLRSRLCWKSRRLGGSEARGGGGGALGYFLGGYLPPGTPNWHPVLKKNSPKIDTPF